jgi:hypothetical protein
MDRGERVSHTLTLLKKLIAVGILPTEYGYIQTKKALEKWMSDGEALESQIQFARYGRVGYLSIFTDKSPEILLKATDELKEQVASE